MPSIRRIIPEEVLVKDVLVKEVTREKKAGFAADPVSGVSRPANLKESWAAYEFEAHARRCYCCRDPYEVYRTNAHLCERGHKLAQDVAIYLYNEDGETFSTLKEENKLVRVEIPEAYDEVRGLLKAIERSLRHRHRSAPFVSMDKSYFVPSRAATDRPRTIKVRVEQVEKPKRPLSGEIVDWPKVERRATIDVNRSTSPRSSKRGSLYDDDMVQQRRDRPKYNVEIREPARGSSGYHP